MFDVRGWEDSWEDEANNRKWFFEASVKPGVAHSEPMFAYVAELWVTTWGWSEPAGDYVVVGLEKQAIHRSEHGSLAAGAKAVKRAYRRAFALRAGPEDR